MDSILLVGVDSTPRGKGGQRRQNCAGVGESKTRGEARTLTSVSSTTLGDLPSSEKTLHEHISVLTHKVLGSWNFGQIGSDELCRIRLLSIYIINPFIGGKKRLSALNCDFFLLDTVVGNSLVAC